MGHMKRPEHLKPPKYLSPSPPVPDPEPVPEDDGPVVEKEKKDPTRYGDWERKGIAWDF